VRRWARKGRGGQRAFGGRAKPNGPDPVTCMETGAEIDVVAISSTTSSDSQIYAQLIRDLPLQKQSHLENACKMFAGERLTRRVATRRKRARVRCVKLVTRCDFDCHPSNARSRQAWTPLMSALQGAARSAYRKLWRASSSTFAGDFPVLTGKCNPSRLSARQLMRQRSLSRENARRRAYLENTARGCAERPN
jgi:hypothetical protein